MLVLSRKVGQRITVGEITLCVVRVDGDKVRLGIEAPREMPIFREELPPERRVPSGRQLADRLAQPAAASDVASAPPASVS